MLRHPFPPALALPGESTISDYNAMTSHARYSTAFPCDKAQVTSLHEASIEMTSPRIRLTAPIQP